MFFHCAIMRPEDDGLCRAGHPPVKSYRSGRWADPRRAYWHVVEDDDEAQEGGSLVWPPGGRVHQDWRADDVPDDPIDDCNGVCEGVLLW